MNLPPAIPPGIAPAAQAIREGRLRARALTEHYLSRIAGAEPRINAFVALCAADALAQAQAIDALPAADRGPLAGAVLAAKDNIDLRGLPTSGGIGYYRDRLAPGDAPIVVRLRKAGAVFLGKLNLHEGALGATTDNPWFGRTENPLREGFTPGGSSGGSGAAVAAGLCNAALGTDTMGSVRIPAAYCGVCGFKPSRGAIDAGGVMPLAWSLDQVGFLAPRVADLKALWQACEASDPRASDSPILERSRIGVLEDFGPIALDPALPQAYREAAERLALCGHQLQPLRLHGYDWTRVRREAFLIAEIEAAAFHEVALERAPEGFSPAFRDMLRFGAAQSAIRAARAYQVLREARVALGLALAGLDALLLPTTPQASFAFGSPVPRDQADLTVIANVLGAPAVAVPWGRSADGLPLSVQVLCRRGEDNRALALADDLN